MICGVLDIEAAAVKDTCECSHICQDARPALQRAGLGMPPDRYKMNSNAGPKSLARATCVASTEPGIQGHTCCNGFTVTCGRLVCEAVPPLFGAIHDDSMCLYLSALVSGVQGLLPRHCLCLSNFSCLQIDQHLCSPTVAYCFTPATHASVLCRC